MYSIPEGLNMGSKNGPEKKRRLGFNQLLIPLFNPHVIPPGLLPRMHCGSLAAPRLNPQAAELGLSIHLMFAEPQSLIFLIFITIILFMIQISGRNHCPENNGY
jgi:hypothetical protein